MLDAADRPAPTTEPPALPALLPRAPAAPPADRATHPVSALGRHAAAPRSLSLLMLAALSLAARTWRATGPLVAAAWTLLYLVGLLTVQMLPGPEDNWHAAAILMALAAPAALTPLLLLMLADTDDAPLAWRAALHAGLHRAPLMLAGALAYAGAVAFASGMMMIPGLIVALMFGLWWPAAATATGPERTSVLAALRASTDLCERCWPRMLLAHVLTLSTLALATIIVVHTGSALLWLAALLAAPPLLCAWTAVLWRDLQIRAALLAPAPATQATLDATHHLR